MKSFFSRHFLAGTEGTPAFWQARLNRRREQAWLWRKAWLGPKSWERRGTLEGAGFLEGARVREENHKMKLKTLPG